MTDVKDHKLIAWSLFCSDKSQDVINSLSYSNKVIDSQLITEVVKIQALVEEL